MANQCKMAPIVIPSTSGCPTSAKSFFWEMKPFQKLGWSNQKHKRRYPEKNTLRKFLLNKCLDNCNKLRQYIKAKFHKKFKAQCPAKLFQTFSKGVFSKICSKLVKMSFCFFSPYNCLFRASSGISCGPHWNRDFPVTSMEMRSVRFWTRN